MQEEKVDTSMQYNALLEEYKIASQKEMNLERNIWESAGVVGIGSIASIVINASMPDVFSVLLLGAFSVSLVWIWWFMAKRWWDIQNVIILRKQHIENAINIKLETYIKFCDRKDKGREYKESNIEGLTKKNLEELEEIRNKDNGRFGKRGVQKSLRWFPRVVTAIWLAVATRRIITGFFRPNCSPIWSTVVPIVIGVFCILAFVCHDCRDSKKNKKKNGDSNKTENPETSSSKVCLTIYERENRRLGRNYACLRIKYPRKCQQVSICIVEKDSPHVTNHHKKRTRGLHTFGIR